MRKLILGIFVFTSSFALADVQLQTWTNRFDDSYWIGWVHIDKYVDSSMSVKLKGNGYLKPGDSYSVYYTGLPSIDLSVWYAHDGGLQGEMYFDGFFEGTMFWDSTSSRGSGGHSTTRNFTSKGTKSLYAENRQVNFNNYTLRGSKSWWFILDEEAPTFSLAASNSAGVYSSDTWSSVNSFSIVLSDVTDTGSQVAQRKYYWDHNGTTTSQTDFPSVGTLLSGALAVGTHTLFVLVKDNVGNTTTKSIVFKVDTAVPVLSLTKFTGNSWARTASISISATQPGPSGLASLKVFRKGQSGSADTELVNLPTTLATVYNFPSTGSYYFVAVSGAGVSIPSGDYEVQLDQTSPAISLSSVTVPSTGPVNGYYKSYSVTAAGTDGESQIKNTEYTLDEGVHWTEGNSLTFAEEGDRTYQFRATDNAGNQGSTTPVTVKTDRTGPILSVTSVPAYSNAASVVLSLTGTDAKSGFQPADSRYSVNSGTTTLGTSATLTAEGSHTVVFTGYDALGNSSFSSAQVTIDRTLPAISTFQAKRTDGTVLTTAVGSSSATVKLFLAGSDAGSGLKDYDLWTVPGTLSVMPTSLPALYKSFSVPGSGLPASIDFNTADAAQVNGTLVDGQTRTVVMRLTDQAGNAVFQKVSFLVKVSATAAPNAASLVRTWSGRQLTLGWTAVATATGYQVSWLEAGVAKTQTVATASFSLDASNLAKYPGNTSVTFQVKSLDAAGNLSASPAEKVVYTLPTLGTLGAAVPSYSATQGNRATFSYSGGSTGTFRLVREGSHPAVISLVAGQFLDIGLTSHAAYSYHLEGESSDGGVFVEPMASHTYDEVENRPPSAPTLASPASGGWLGPESQFTWGASGDTDGDPLTYSVFVKKTTDAAYGSAMASGLTALTTPLSTSLTNGVSYHWKVVAADSHGGSADQVGTFTFDNVKPSLSWNADPTGLGGYSAGAALGVTGSDTGGSGIGSAIQKVYQRGQEAGAVWTLLSTTNLSSSASAWTLAWPATSGLYQMRFDLTDKAGNSEVIETPAVLVDRQAPVLSSAALDTPVSLGRKALSQGTAFFTGLSAKEPDGTVFSGIAKLEAQFVSTANGGAAGAWQVFRATDGSKDARTYTWGKASKAVDVSAGAYRLNLRITDRAGNQTTTLVPQEYWVDTSAPVVSFEVDGLIVSGQRSYLASVNQLVSILNSSDAESSIVSTQYAIPAASTAPLAWFSSWTDAKSAAGFTGGNSYKPWVRVTNAALGATVVAGPEFVYDPTPPLQASVSLDQSAVWAGDAVRVTVEAQDNESLIADYEVEIGTPADSDLLGSWHLSAGRPTMSLVIPAADAGSYIVTLKAFGGNGLSSTAQTGLIVNSESTRPAVAVTDNGPFSTVVKATMTSTSPDLEFFEYRLIEDEVPGPVWTALAAGANTVVVDSGLTDGSVYKVEVRGVLAGGQRTDSRTSAGVMIDQGQPVWTLAQGPLFGDGRTISLNWNLTATPSGIARVSLVAARGAVVDRLELTPAVQSSGYRLGVQSLGWPDGALVNLTLEVENQAGTVVQKPLAPMVVDRSPPPSPLVGDQGAYHNGRQNLAGQWINSLSDVQTGSTYFWAFTKTPQNLEQVLWNADQGTRRAEVDWHSEVLSEGDQWYFVVKAVNGAGLESVGISDGILIDSSAPFISSVRIARDAAGNEEAAYAVPGTALYLVVAAGDPQSGIDSFEVDYGTKQADVFTRTGGSATQSATASPIVLSAPLYQPTVAQQSLVYEARAKNGATLAEVGYSAGINFTNVKPQVSQVLAQQVGEQLIVTWSTAPGTLGAPVASSKVSIQQIGSNLPVSDWAVAAGTSLSLPLANFSDGNYEVSVQASSLAKLDSEVAKVRFWIDSTPPLAPVLSALPVFVSSVLNLTVTGSDPQSGLAEWSYRLGTEADPGLASGGWVNQVQQTNLALSQSWAAQVPDKSLLFLEVRVKNQAGLWSPITRSPALAVDKTSAVITGLSVKPVSRGILLQSAHLEDLESGLTSYELTVQNAQGQQVGPATVVSAAGAKQLDLTNVPVNVGTLTHAAAYTLTIRAANGSGAPAGQAVSSLIRIDLNAPVLQYQNPSGWPSHNGGFVVNSLGVNLTYLASDDVSSQLNLSGSVTSPSGTVTPILKTGHSAGTSGTVLVAGSEFGIYTVSLVAVDEAGNSTASVVKTLRHNRSPLVALDDAATTPGRVLTLSAAVSDPEGDTLAYLWDFGDGTSSSTLAAATHAYHHKAAANQLSEYTLKLTVTDQFGAQTVTTKTVQVANTLSGNLFEDEIWAGERVITGVVRVPAGVKLTLESTARIRFQGNPVDGWGQALIVEGQLLAQSGAQLTKAAGQTQRWAGIFVRGQAQITGTVIRDAQRGLTAASGATVSLASSILTENEIGLHVLGTATVTATSNQITNNRVFGVKEDDQGRPSLIGNTFAGNRENYYQWDGAVLRLDGNLAEINDLTGRNAPVQNSGNQGE